LEASVFIREIFRSSLKSLNILPVPSTTLHSGSSAIETGNPVSSRIRLSRQRSSQMKKLLLVCFACTLLVSLVAAAQPAKPGDPATQGTVKMSAQEKQAEKAAKEIKTMTGCLQKGDEPGEFSIAGEDGKLWGLRSSTVKLEDHVGHKVTVTVTGESKAEEKKEKKEGEVEKASQKEEYGDIRVRSLKMISDTCAK
jgi:hypothetical protein